ncbi:hypothetical protein M9458_050463, partial [Cirrhinus mrigala]
SYSQVKLPSPNYKGRKSELCVLGIEKRPKFTCGKSTGKQQTIKDFPAWS